MDAELVNEFETYPFDTDQVFQEGIRNIEGSEGFDSKSLDEQEAIIGRAKAFYLAKVTGKPFSWDAYVQERQSKHISSKTEELASVMDRKTEPELTLREITHLIETGQTHLIPNNLEIPPGVNESTPSQALEIPKKKPWENINDLQ